MRLLGLLALLALATPAWAEVTTPPDWIEEPTDEAMWLAAPLEADGRPGEVILGCRVAADGAVHDCVVQFERPTGLGFGDAALKLSTLFKMRPMLKDGKPVAGGVVHIPIRWTEGPHGGGVITSPDWLRKPSAQDLSRVVPARAAKEGRNGQATIACRVNLEGGVYDCAVVEEDPAGYGFGEAALAMSSSFAMRPMSLDGKPVAGAVVRIPIRWLGMRPSHQIGASVLRAPPWGKAPNFDQLLAAYPEKARRKAVAGRVTLMCRYGKAGTLSACDVHDEDPKDAEFGRAARKLAPLFQGPALGAELQRHEVMAMVFVTFPTEALKGDRRIGKPDWRALPTEDDMLGAYPQAARQARLSGDALVHCLVVDGGALEGCRVLRETPAGQGFGEAALKVLAPARMSVWSDEGLPTAGGYVNIPVRFHMPSAEPEAAAK